jgi:hypothetical protein
MSFMAMAVTSALMGSGTDGLEILAGLFIQTFRGLGIVVKRVDELLTVLR